MSDIDSRILGNVYLIEKSLASEIVKDIASVAGYDVDWQIDDAILSVNFSYFTVGQALREMGHIANADIEIKQDEKVVIFRESVPSNHPMINIPINPQDIISGADN